MNICYYTTRLPNPNVGGVERVTYNLENYFRSVGIGVHNITLQGNEHEGLIPAGASTEDKARFVNRYLEKHNIDILIDQYGDKPFLRHPLIDSKFKIIQCQHLMPVSRFLARRLLGTFFKTRWRESLLNVAFFLNTPRRKRKNRRNLDNQILEGGVDMIVLLSDRYKTHFVKRYGSHMHKICAIPNACEPKLLNVKVDESRKLNQIVWCGRIVHSPKNVLFLIKLWKTLYQRFPDWEMVIVGDGIDRHILDAEIVKLSLPRIKITGYTDPYPYYQTSRIMVCPSFVEGFGMVLLEAMAHKCVPVTFDNSAAFHDIIDNGENGVIVESDNDRRYIEACATLMQNPQKLMCMAKKASSVAEKFSINKIGAKWIHLFETLAHNDAVAPLSQSK